MHQSPAAASEQLLRRQMKLDDDIDLDAGGSERPRLGNGARITVEEKPRAAVCIADALRHQLDDDAIRHQAAGVHVAPGLEPERGAGLHRRTQHVAR